MDIELNFYTFATRSGCAPDFVERLRARFLQEGVWIAGGAIRRTLINQPLDSDVDFFFKDQQTLNAWEARHKELLGEPDKETIHHKQWTIKGLYDDKEQETIIQAIKFNFFQSARHVIQAFDYTITQFVLDRKGTLTTTSDALWDLGRRRLAINRVTYPVATSRRLLKYTSQGFTACNGCLAELHKQTIENPETHKQLDVAYVD